MTLVFFNPECGNSMFHQKFGIYLQLHTVILHRWPIFGTFNYYFEGHCRPQLSNASLNWTLCGLAFNNFKVWLQHHCALSLYSENDRWLVMWHTWQYIDYKSRNMWRTHLHWLYSNENISVFLFLYIKVF